MKLTWGERFWPARSRPLVQPRPLDGDAGCDVLVVGAGITGAFVADALVAAGLDTIVVDKREPGCGSTSASTALLLYELDTPLHALMGMVGQEHAVRSYRMGIDAIARVERLVQDLGDDCGFARRESLYVAGREEELPDLQSEFDCRRRFEFPVEFLSRSDIGSRMGFDRPGAILSREAAQVDPYRLNQRVLERAVRRGVRLFGRTRIVQVQPRDEGIRAVTEAGPSIFARRIVHATGYEAAGIIGGNLARSQVTYAVASEPLASFAGWRDQWLIWETSRPYLYLRSLPDGRAMIGGEDDPDLRYINDRQRLDRKRQALQARFADLFPAINFRPAAAWGGIFETTPDGLPYIGPHARFPRALFALGYGGNGMTFSIMASEILRDLCTGRANADAEIFRFDRRR